MKVNALPLLFVALATAYDAPPSGVVPTPAGGTVPLSMATIIATLAAEWNNGTPTVITQVLPVATNYNPSSTSASVTSHSPLPSISPMSSTQTMSSLSSASSSATTSSSSSSTLSTSTMSSSSSLGSAPTGVPRAAVPAMVIAAGVAAFF